MAWNYEPYSSQDLAFFETADLHRRFDKSNNLLVSSHGSRVSKLERRDKLSRQLQAIENGIEEVIYKDSPKGSAAIELDQASTKNLHSFLKWRSQLKILHNALERSIEHLLRMRTSRSNPVVEELQELKDVVDFHLTQTAGWTTVAEERLRELSTSNRRDSPTRSLEAIVNEAEKVRSVSMNLSLEMKAEVKALRSECVELAKDLVAMNRILEERKGALAAQGMGRAIDSWSSG